MSTDIYEGEVVWGFSASEDSERWDGPVPTREQAEAACRDHFDNGGYVCEARWLSPGKIAAAAIDMDDLLRRMDECDEVLGAFDDTVFEIIGPAACQAAKDDLAAAVKAWAERHVKVRHWMCVGDAIRVEAGGPDE